MDLSEYAARNREIWNTDAPQWVQQGREAWASATPWWGMWHVPEEELNILPDVSGLDVVDLGCGTGYWCAWFAKLGARPVGLDLSEEQLATARMLQEENGIEFPLIHASAEDPPLPDGSFDIVFSEFGAAIWCDPYVWIPHAHRLLRPGGRLIFLCHSILDSLCTPDGEEPTGERLVRPQRGLRKIDWREPSGAVSTDFHQPHGERIKLLRDTGFELEALHELYAPEGPTDEVRYYVARGWAQTWPGEEVWVARRTSAG
jgi:SAM-dependent methyltransferase